MTLFPTASVTFFKAVQPPLIPHFHPVIIHWQSQKLVMSSDMLRNARY